MTEQSLLTKYRPAQWDEVVGQDAVVRSLRAAIKDNSAHAFLLIGPSGCGKTTLARLAAVQLGCKPMDLEEIDAATNTGVDDMRAVAVGLDYRPLGGGSVKVVVVDESHQLSKAAWNSLLKIIEEPPEYVYWFFCTTEPGKVPESVKTRCLKYELKPVSSSILVDMLQGIVDSEDLKVSDEVVSLCAREANGSPRQALANLGVCGTAKTRDEAAELLQSAIESSQVIDLARALYRRASWKELQPILAGLKDVNPESIRQTVRAYGTSIVLGKNGASPASAGPAIEIMDVFSEMFHSGDGLTPVILACAKLTLS